jgi:hypothetical protein
MRRFAYFSVAYFIVAVVVSTSVGDGFRQIAGSITSFLNLVLTNPYTIALIAVCVVAARLLWREDTIWREFLLAVVSVCFFQTAFTTMKTAMPFIMPFWADPLFIDLDRALHFGIDPWSIAHAGAPWFDATVADLIYLRVWIGIAVFFPILLAATERDRTRLAMYLALYAIAWVGIGNLLALPFLSAGPIYAEAFHGDRSFAELHAALEATGVTGSTTGFIQSLLLYRHQEGLAIFGSGISAFPSVHVAVAAVVAFYLHDRFRHPATTALGLGFLGMILFLSVWLGWHYAVDGYVSIAVLALARHVIRRRLTPRKETAPPAGTEPAVAHWAGGP